MQDQPLGRHVLPIPHPVHVGVTTCDAKDPDTSFPPITPLRPPKGAPNVLVVLLDDAGGSTLARCRSPLIGSFGERCLVFGARAVRADPAGAGVAV